MTRTSTDSTTPGVGGWAPFRSASRLSDLTRFIGREQELEQVSALLEDSRLLTLTGAGGSGKTRLALEVLRRKTGTDREKTAWVELASVHDPALLPQRILESLGIREEVPLGGGDGLAAFLGTDPLILVLDNCEHLVEECAALATELLTALPTLRILATSREALGIRGERAWLVPPLSLTEAPEPLTDLVESEAVRLFVDRVRDTVPAFQVTKENAEAVFDICFRLDGIPLALELAAARVRVLPPEQIRDRLDDVFHLLTTGDRTAVPRHRTLRAAIDWSYELLPEPERILFRRLGVFRGSFTLEAAELVGGGGEELDLDEPSVLDGVARLVERSLLRVSEAKGVARYRFLETIRQYALARLKASGEEEVIRDRHASHLAREVKRAEPQLTRPQRKEWVDRLLGELEDLRTALRWTRERDPRLHIELVGDLWWFWYSTRYWMEGRNWLEEALELPEAQTPDLARARLLFALGALRTLQGEVDAGRGLLNESADLARSLEDLRLEAYALTYIGLGLGQRRDPSLAEPVDQALTWFRAHDDPYGLRLALLLAALAAQFAGRPEEADALSNEAIAVARRFGRDRELAIALQNWSVVQLQRGHEDRAESLVLESLDALRADPSYLFLARGIGFIGEVAGRRGNPLQAARLLGLADALRSSIGARPFAFDQMRVHDALPGLRAAAGEDAFDRAWEQGAAEPWQSVVAELLSDRPAADSQRDPPPVLPPVPPPSPVEVTAATTGDHVALRVRALGPFEVEVEGRAQDSEDWSYARPRELLVFLLLHPRGASRDEIGLALWPDATPAQVKNSFHVTAHHLRKRLGRADWLVLEGERYRLAPAGPVEWDGATLEAGVREILEGEPGGGDIPRLRELLSLYRGELLEGAGRSRWLEEARDRFRRIVVDGRLALARILVEEGAADDAVREFQSVVQIEELNEEAHRGLMRAWAESGHRDRAIRHFEHLENLLREFLEAEPEAATRDLHRRIQSAADLGA